MARPIDDYEDFVKTKRAGGGTDRRASRSTARAFAAAVSAFAISALVITTSSDALSIGGTVAQTSVEAGTITLSDDDENRALFALENMAPNRPSTECIQVSYDGSILPVVVSMAAKPSGSLAPYLQLTIEQGTGAGFRDCTGFEPTTTVFDGTLAQLGLRGSQRLGEFLNLDETMSFRFRFEMQDVQAAVGQTSSVDFAWEVTPS